MRPERAAPGPVLASRWGSLGDLATAAFAVAAVSGVVVAVPFDAHDPAGSIAAMLLANPSASFFRNVHYWASQIFLVLTVAHVWDHLRARTESRVTRGVWTRLALTLPIAAFLMLSGFLLRGDAEAQQALRILSEATRQLPLAGPLVATLLFGAGGRLDVVYIQHAATATLVVGLFVVEHARRVWPKTSAFVAVVLASSAPALFLSAGLHDGLDPVVKGPWYFLGLQEVLHWTPWPFAVVAGGLAILAAVFAVREAGAAWAARIKASLLALLIGYALACGVGAFMRGESWSWQPRWPGGAGDLRFGFVFASNGGAPAGLPSPLPTAMNRPEGCLICHTGVTGLGNAHRPEAVGCASCHLGDIFTLDKARAHRGMRVIPGNLADAARTCGQVNCHPSVVPRVERTVMSTMSGIIGVDRLVFGEVDAKIASRPVHVAQLGSGPADTHLRQLCASCHLGRAKTEPGPNHEDSRGGGCNACHLSYAADAAAALLRYTAAKAAGPADAPHVHPALSLDIGNGQCFGCHSRSGRISTSYEGWHEREAGPRDAPNTKRPGPPTFRTLEDGRVFERVIPDIHQQRGLDCIDCHTAVEVMGDGTSHARKSGQLRVACEDCHTLPGATPFSMAASALDPESARIVALRAWPGPAASHVGRTRAGDALVNVAFDSNGAAKLIRKRTGERRDLKPATPVCREAPGHTRLSCGSCHTAWAPRCPTCHTTFDRGAAAYDWVADADVRGAWKEEPGPYAAAPPSLGVRSVADPVDGRREVVDTFAPGMVLTIDRNAGAGASGSAGFRRLYARVEPHTTRREVRPCASCHNDPEALGYGRGQLRFVVSGGGRGRWTFTPASAAQPQDGLPADAWIPFLGSRTGMLSTRDDVRPFTVEEQRRILRVGACLTCHDPRSAAMRDSVRDFDAVLRRRSPRCVSPIWP